jgi:NADPH:quinone reductase-like Zn-dependent oxidoreductase
MRAVVVCGSRAKKLIPKQWRHTVEIDDAPALFALVRAPRRRFDRRLPKNSSNVLVKTRAFSCNFRDKALLFTAIKMEPDRLCALGSEFVGEVLEVGRQVTDLQAGDRVIGNNHYVGGQKNSPPYEGVPTNHASEEYHVFHHQKLIKIPPEMSDDVAAGFSIGAQTAYSMVRKLEVTEESNVLVTAARSNTSLFAINRLRTCRANIYATTTSTRSVKKLLASGVKEVLRIDPGAESFLQHRRLRKIVRDVGGFDCVVDPYFDIHLNKVINLMAPGGKYITCGLFDQYQALLGRDFQTKGPDMSAVFTRAIIGNVRLIGNCVGLTEDLQQALDDYASGRLPVIIDSVFSGNDVGAFIHRTYSDPERFGKVIYRY